MIIDTHCHLSKQDYDIDNYIKEAIKSSVKYLIVSGCTKDSIIESIDIAKKYKNVLLTIGFHPTENITDEDLIFLKDCIKSNKIIGIGEIGLDYHYDNTNKINQQKYFEKQLKIAKEFNLPVVIHSRDAFLDTYNILKKYNVKGIIHCFGGSYEEAVKYIELGFKIGIGGIVTFKNSDLDKVVEKIGINNIVLETDSPYLAPTPVRGSINTSKNLVHIVSKISDIIS